MRARTAIDALRDIAYEILASGDREEPANPALKENLERVIECFDAGGTVFGYYGSGKSLLSLLYSIIKTGQGETTIVIEANIVLRLEGERTLGEISPTIRALELLKHSMNEASVLSVIMKWLNKHIRQSMSEDNVIKRLEEAKSKNIELKGKGFDKLLNVIRYLHKLNVNRIVVDEFERLIVSYDVYGYNTPRDLLEDFFVFADRKDPSVAIAIPHTLRSMLDLETLSRIQPIVYITYEPKDLIVFFKNFVNIYSKADEDAKRILEEFSEVSIGFKVPRAVVNIASEAVERGSLREIVLDRLSALYIIANSYPTRSIRKRACLFLLYCYAWFYQNIYEPIEDHKLRSVMLMMHNLYDHLRDKVKISERFEKYLRDLMDEHALLECARDTKLVERVGNTYLLSVDSVSNLIRAISDERFSTMILTSANIKFELKSLSIEMQLQGVM